MKRNASRQSKSQPAKSSNRTKPSGTKAFNAAAKSQTNAVAGGERIQRAPIAKIDIGNRYRKDYGDLKPLADSIQALGLLQPVGITEDFKLVFGGRRLCACRDVLNWKQIEVRIVKVSSIIRGEHDENELRKDFTPSERVAIAKALEAEIGERRGNPSIRHRGDELKGRSDALVAKQAGFGSRRSLRDAQKVIKNGSPQLVEAMDKEKMSITAAARLARLPTEKQNELLDRDVRKIRQAASKVPLNGKALPAESSAKGNPANSRSPVDESAKAIFTDINHHHDTMETILAPICDEGQDVRLRSIEKRTLMRIVQELRGFISELQQAWPADG